MRTNWVLHTAGVAAPKLLLDVRPTAATICRRDVLTAKPADTFLSVYRKMIEHGFRSIPVVDDEGRLLGVPSIQDMAQLFLPAEAGTHAGNRAVPTSLQNIVTALGGTSSTSGTGNDYTFTVAKPTVTALSPDNAVVAGGGTITITGTNFVNPATVTFGEVAADRKSTRLNSSHT